MGAIDLGDWTLAYVSELFLNRGYDPEDSRYQAVVASQASHWRRLIARYGLAGNENEASNVAFEFAMVHIEGGAARIFEAFATFMAKRPKPDRLDTDPSPAPSSCGCCGGLGVIVGPGRSKAGKPMECAWRCRCTNGIRYAGIPPADGAMMDHGRNQQIEAAERARAWYAELGGDFDNDPPEYLMALARERFRGYRTTPIFKSV